MRKITFLTIIGLAFAALLTGACASDSNTATTNQAAPTGNTAAVTNNASAANNSTMATKSDDEIPAAVKAVFPDAQTFTKQHKDIPAEKIQSIEKDTGGRVADKDHHSYLAFATVGGKRTQIGAATIIKTGGKEMIVIYESKNGMPTIKEVRADGVEREFTAQFAGKNHDAKIKFGEDIKAGGGVSEAQAKEIAQAVRIDVLAMEALYGAAHTH